MEAPPPPQQQQQPHSPQPHPAFDNAGPEGSWPGGGGGGWGGGPGRRDAVSPQELAHSCENSVHGPESSGPVIE